MNGIFLLFAFDYYDQRGGFLDLESVHSDIQGAVIAASERINEKPLGLPRDYFNICFASPNGMEFLFEGTSRKADIRTEGNPRLYDYEWIEWVVDYQGVFKEET